MLFHIAEALIMFTWRFVLLPGWLAAAVMTGAMAVNTAKTRAVEQRVNGLVVTVGNVATQASNAQSTANTGVSNAAAAQSTANSAASTASSAASTAASAQSTANSKQSALGNAGFLSGLSAVGGVSYAGSNGTPQSGGAPSSYESAYCGALGSNLNSLLDYVNALASGPVNGLISSMASHGFT